MALIEVNGDMRRRAHGFLRLAKRVAGPDPIDLPNKIIWSSLTPCFMVRKSYTFWASIEIYSADGSPS